MAFFFQKNTDTQHIRPASAAGPGLIRQAYTESWNDDQDNMEAVREVSPMVTAVTTAPAVGASLSYNSARIEVPGISMSVAPSRNTINTPPPPPPWTMIESSYYTLCVYNKIRQILLILFHLFLYSIIKLDNADVLMKLGGY